MDFSTCSWDSAKFFIFSDNVFGSLIYYSHLSSLILSLIIGILVYFQDRRSLPNRLLFIITILFSTFTFFDLILWATGNPSTTIFIWSLVNLIEPFIYFFAFYFSYVFIKEKDFSIVNKIFLISPLFVTIILTPTIYGIIGFNFSNCDREAIEGPLVYYNYIIEIIYVLGIAVLGIREYIKAQTKESKNKIILFIVGISLFLLSFSFGNIIGTLTDDWTIGQYGFIGMPVFVAFLSYLIVKYKAFNIKIIASQILVSASWFLIFAILFIRKIENVRFVVVITLFIVAIIGWLLVKGIKREIKQKEEMEAISKNLIEANEKLKGLDKLKTEFLSLATHQIRSPLTAIKGYTSMLLEGSFGKVVPEQKEPLERVLQTSNSLAIMVEDFLSVSKIESGGMKYMTEPFNFKEMVNDTYSDLKITAEKKGLGMDFSCNTDELVMVSGDREKLRQVVINLIDNSIKYTPEGSVSLNLTYENNKVLFSIKDTGVGVSPETKEKLFHKFNRGEAGKMNTTGSGLGLYLAKEIIKAHHGRVWLQSEGLGKGTTFFVELPTIPKE